MPAKRKPRTWKLRYSHSRFGNTVEGPFTDKARAVAHAERLAREHNTPVRVATSGHFGSLTVNPPGERNP
jgi:hypothetical protein